MLARFWQSLDPKLKHTVIVAVVTWAAVKLGIGLDADASALLSLIAGAVAGYRVENEGSILRQLSR